MEMERETAIGKGEGWRQLEGEGEALRRTK